MTNIRREMQQSSFLQKRRHNGKEEIGLPGKHPAAAGGGQVRRKGCMQFMHPFSYWIGNREAFSLNIEIHLQEVQYEYY